MSPPVLLLQPLFCPCLVWAPSLRLLRSVTVQTLSRPHQDITTTVWGVPKPVRPSDQRVGPKTRPDNDFYFPVDMKNWVSGCPAVIMITQLCLFQTRLL